MHEWFGTGAMPVFVVCCAVICLEMLALTFATPILRAKRNVWLNEEDAERFAGVVAEAEHPDVARLVRVHRNQIENFAPFLALGLLWVMSGAWAAAGIVFFVTFTGARTAHAAFYLRRMGRLRTASHTIGFFVLVVLSGGLLLKALGGGGR